MEMFSRVVGTGRALPGQPVSNAALVERLAKSGIESSDEWIRERTGISQRYIAAEGVTSSDLAAQAAQEALSAAGLSAAQLEMIIVATSTPDMIFPSTACLVQKKIGASGGPAFDVQAVCSGFAYAMATADLFIKAGKVRNALVIGAEVFSGILDWTDRGTCVLFGDGAGAVVLTAVSTTAPAPSPKSTQVPRSVQSKMPEKTSAPMTNALRTLPALINKSAVAMA